MKVCASMLQITSRQKGLRQSNNYHRPRRSTSKHQSNQVSQLGEQPNQTIPPLKVLSKKDEAIGQFVVESSLTKAQI